MSDTGVLYLIECRTGCSCCSSENHYRGPFATKEEAERRVDYFLDPSAHNNPLASQYARKGHYSIEEYGFFFMHARGKKELIISDKVHDFTEGFITVNEKGEASREDYLTNEL